MRTVVLTLVLALSGPASAEIYKIVNPDGTVTYSDRPATGAEAVDLPGLQTYEAPDLEPATGEERAPGFEYELFEVSEPVHEQTFRDNGGVVPIRLTLKPGLYRDHTIAIFMDGEDLGASGRSTSITLENVDRGSHTVHAVIRDADGREVERTSGVTFHLHRTSILN